MYTVAKNNYKTGEHCCSFNLLFTHISPSTISVWLELKRMNSQTIYQYAFMILCSMHIIL